ncbi:MAG: hypothetical protein Q4D96_09225 [Propionibacteriaceae bacterium]|nr:hypothetical protein [Propionibacteriaceae bacterium]
MGTTNNAARGPGLDILRDGLAPHQVIQDQVADEQHQDPSTPVEQPGLTEIVDPPPDTDPELQPEAVTEESAAMELEPPANAGALTASLRALGDLPEATGWRKVLGLGPSKTQLQAAERKARLLVGFPGSMVITAASVKGEAGKTTTMRGIMAALANARGGGVVMVDMNEVSGTAALRSVVSHDRNVGDILNNIDYLMGRRAQLAELEWCMHRQPDSSEWVLACDPEATELISQEEFAKLHTVLKRFYSIIGFDTGNTQLLASWQAACQVADVYVVPVKWRGDHCVPARNMLEAMLKRDPSVRDRLIIVGTNTVSNISPLEKKVVVDHFSELGLPIWETPFDPGLHQQVIRWNSLKPATQVVFEELAAELLAKATTTTQQKEKGGTGR